MSMNHDPQNFEALRRLLTLKRHEQPPPGYFHAFSREVISRIRAGERAPDHAFESWFNAPWVRKFWAALETKPAFAGVFGASLCAIMLWAVVSTENIGTSSAVIPSDPLPDPFQQAATAGPAPLLEGMVSFSSTNGFVAQGRSDLFGGGLPKASFAKFPMTQH
jgi:hypothetical protein